MRNYLKCGEIRALVLKLALITLLPFASGVLFGMDIQTETLYQIKSKYGHVLDAEWANKNRENHVNVFANGKNPYSNNTYFMLTRSSMENYYHIKTQYGHVLDAEWANKNIGKHVNVFANGKEPEWDNTLFRIETASDNYYRIFTNSGHVLDAERANENIGEHVNVFANGKEPEWDNTLFEFIPVPTRQALPISKKVIGTDLNTGIDHVYALRGVANGKYLDGRNHETEVIMTDRNPTGNDQTVPLRWNIIPMKDGTYALRGVASGKYLDGRNHETEVIMTDRNPEGDRPLNWNIVRVGEGTYALRGVASGKYLDGRNHETEVIMTDRNPKADDKPLNWQFIPL